MDNEKLNEKLARWAGFEEGTHITNRFYGSCQWHKGDKFWKRPDGFQCSLPNFASGLDACFKWLVPKLNSFHYQYSITINDVRDGWYCQLYNVAAIKPRTEKRIDMMAETPALALCKAIERLIEAEDE